MEYLVAVFTNRRKSAQSENAIQRKTRLKIPSFSDNVFDVFLSLICDNLKRVMRVEVDLAIDVAILMLCSQTRDNSGFKEITSIRKSRDFLRVHRLCT